MFVAGERTGVGGAGGGTAGGEGGTTDPPGCVFIGDGPSGGPGQACGAPRRPGSSYCEAHHRLCHLPPGGRGEARRLMHIEGLAGAAGGRLGRNLRLPPDAFLSRLERSARLLSRQNRSRFVPDRMRMGGDRG